MKYKFRGNILKELRLKMGATQYELARRINKTKDTISNLERGIDTDPHFSTVIRLATYFGVCIGRFCGLDDFCYVNENMKKLIRYFNQGFLKKDLLTKALEVYENQDIEINRKRVEILRKVYISNENTINSIYHLICE